MNDTQKALEILWSIGLHPGYYDDIVKAAEGVREMVQHFRSTCSDPPHDIQCLVLKKLEVYGFTDGAPARLKLVEVEEKGVQED